MISKTVGRELQWFFIMFGKEFRENKQEAFETLMLLAVAHSFKCSNPKEFADFLGIPYQQVYAELQGWSLYYLREMLVRFLVHQAEEELKAVLAKSAATQSRAGITLSVDNSVIDRLGKLLRCTWSWYSGRWKKVVTGQDLLGVVLTINGKVFPLYLWFCPKQGSANTDKPSLLLAMLTRLKEEFEAVALTLTDFPITMDSWFVSEDLKTKLHTLGFTKIIIAGKGNYVLTIEGVKHPASGWKKTLPLQDTLWGIDVPACRVKAISPTFGEIVVFFYRKRITRNYYLLDFSKTPLRGVEIWHIWKQHGWIEWFWKMLKTVFKITAMRLRGIGLYTGLLIKVLAYLVILRMQSHRKFSHLSMTQIMRKIQRELTLQELMDEHFHLPAFFYQGEGGASCLI
jgi:hypothetical protein